MIPNKDEWRSDIQTAKDLCYPQVVIEKLRKEPDPSKRQRILHDARMGIYKRPSLYN